MTRPRGRTEWLSTFQGHCQYRLPPRMRHGGESVRNRCGGSRELQPDAELQLQPFSSLEQLEAIRSGRLDAGFVFNMPKTDPELALLPVGVQHIELAVLKGNPLAKLKKVRLRDLADETFVWFPRRESPVLYDRLMRECFRGGLKFPRIVQEGLNEATILSLVANGLGVGWVLGTARWRCPKNVVIISVSQLEPATAAVSRFEETIPRYCSQVLSARRGACRTCEGSTFVHCRMRLRPWSASLRFRPCRPDLAGNLPDRPRIVTPNSLKCNRALTDIRDTDCSRGGTFAMRHLQAHTFAGILARCAGASPQPPANFPLTNGA